MEWKDTGIIISAKKHGEYSLIIRAITSEHGLRSGVVRSAKKFGGICQSGNLVSLVWNGRLEEHLGRFSCELEKSFFASILDDMLKLSSLASACVLIEKSLPEREPHREIFNVLYDFLISLETKSWLKEYVLFELTLLKELGYGLDLATCAATGVKDHLCYVSPKSGRAVSMEGGEAYKDRILKLPAFLRPQYDESYTDNTENISEFIDGVVLTRYFLMKHVFEGGIPIASEQFLQKLREN